MLFSILIPVYNAERYLYNTVQSVLNQNENSFEIVLVNDGSVDNSASICDQLAKEYSGYIHSFHQINKGVYLTRCILAGYAQGEYLIFLDADDILMPNALSTLRESIEKTNADIVLFDLEKQYSQRRELYTLPFENNSFFSGDSLMQVYKVLLLTKYLNSMCTKAIKKKCFKTDTDDTEYNLMKIGLDKYQSYLVLDEAETILYLKQVLYIYIKNNESITGTINYHDYFNSIQIHMKRAEYYIKKWRLPKEDIYKVYSLQVSNMCNCIIRAACDQQTVNNKALVKEYVEKVRNNSFFINAMQFHHHLSLRSVIKLLSYLVLKGNLFMIRVLINLIKLYNRKNK